jgi:transcriptional regulator
MYLPALFTESDLAIALQLMRENPLANVITDGAELVANPLPTIADSADGNVSIRFHLATRNAQCETLTNGARCLLVFTGPNCYVSPSWYTEHPNVPSWNYVSAHVYGHVEVLDEAALEELLRELSRRHEESVGGSWEYDSLPLAFKRELLAEIRGFRVRASRVETKLKLSQNRLSEDRVRVTERLLASPDPTARAVGRWMAERFPELTQKQFALPAGK